MALFLIQLPFYNSNSGSIILKLILAQVLVLVLVQVQVYFLVLFLVLTTESSIVLTIYNSLHTPIFCFSTCTGRAIHISD